MRTWTWIAAIALLGSTPATGAALAATAPQRGPDPSGADPSGALGAVTPAVEGTEVLVSARGRDDTVAGVEVVVFLPSSRPAWLAAVREIARVERQHGAAVAVVALVAEGSEALATVRSRDGATRCAKLLDIGGRNRDAFAPWLGDEAGAVFVLRDTERRALAVGRLGGGLRHDIADALDGKLPVSRDPDTGRVANRAGRARVVLPTLDETRPEPWLRAVTAVDQSELRATLRAALRALRERPEFQAKVLEAVARRDAEALGGEFGRRALTAIQRDEPRCADVQRAAFIGFAGLGDTRRAHGAAFAWLEAIKGIPGRAHEMLAAVDAAPGGAECYAAVVDRTLDLGLLASADDPLLLRRGLDHALVLRDDLVQARRHALALVAVLAGDAQALNSLSWRLLTDAPYAGRFTAAALAAARAMQDCAGWQTYWRVDTLALACHENGLHDEAVRWQRDAVDGCDPTARHRYAARLERYEQARAAAK